jgi:hypothetical protein
VVLKSQRNLFAPKAVLHKKKDRVGVSVEPLAETGALVISKAGSPQRHSQQPSSKASKNPFQNSSGHRKVELTSSDRALATLLCDAEYLGSLV